MLLGVSTFLLGLVRIGWPEVKFFQLSPEDKLLIIFPLEVVINFPGKRFSWMEETCSNT